MPDVSATTVYFGNAPGERETADATSPLEAILRQNGFQHVRNVVGGILAWSDKVDPSVPKY